MPIVFVHGVSNRSGSEYDRCVEQRTEFLRSIVAPELGLDAENVRFYNPYWGDEGVKFRWNNASIPIRDNKYETFGAEHDEEDIVLAVQLPELSSYANSDIVEIAKKSLPEAVDILWAAAMTSANNKELHEDLAKTYAQIADYAERENSPAWLAQASPSNFVDQLLEKAKSSSPSTSVADQDQPAYESLGISTFHESLAEAASRIRSVLGNMTGDVMTVLGRSKAHLGTSLFIGDVFQYLTYRGDKNEPGKIPELVIKALRDADQARTSEDPYLVVIGHSLGGVISYDVLTHFVPELEVSMFVSIGSQVGLFEEMTLYKESKENKPINPPTDRLMKPANIMNWLNIFDTTDIFSFSVEGVFDGAQDFLYDTGFGLSKAHSGYFERPSFYRRLAARLKDMDT